jgi:hypothetical protein
MVAKTDRQTLGFAPDGSVWSHERANLMHHDLPGRAVAIPLFAAPAKDVAISQVFAVSADDILVVAGEGTRETLLFRTKPMSTLLTCDGSTG